MKIVVHGRGNAWPVPLGEEHPFYDRTDYRDLSNASFSLVVSNGDEIEADILIDAGHGTIQSLISGSNRIPNSICLTHGHLDHTLGVDWVVQSYWRQHNREKRYPVYATKQVYRLLIQSYPQLEALVEYRELEFGQRVKLKNAVQTGNTDLYVTAFPVYHGAGALGASMLLFQTGSQRVLFTGDLFTPLLREADYSLLQDVDIMVVDSNNRFPWPRTNHWSFAGQPDDPFKRSPVLNDFLAETSFHDFIRPHAGERDSSEIQYFDQLESEWNPATQPFTILEFLRRTGVRQVVPVHYSGTEDRRYYDQAQLNGEMLLSWMKSTAAETETGSSIYLPEVGEVLFP